MTSICALDLETTGLDPKSNEITEVGIIRFNENRIEDEFSMLVNPMQLIPRDIVQLTGISNEMVANAPLFSDVAAEIEAFVGDAPILGHNVMFDVGFLRKRGLFHLNDTLDTYDLAAVMLPNASRYNLGALGKLMGVPYAATHRAIDDARVTMVVYQRLMQKIENELPLNVLAEIVRNGSEVEWGGGYAFRHALENRSRTVIDIDAVLPSKKKLKPLRAPKNAIKPESNEIKLDIEECTAVLEYGGVLSQELDGYEYRPQQAEMTASVAEALSEGYHLMVEAGTGTGKSFGYCIPAAQFALANDTRVVISTNTINLQEQLINKDIPVIQKYIAPELNVSVMKGRNNYFCPKRFDGFRRKQPKTANEMRIFAKLMVWLLENETGDLNDINLNGPDERYLWSKISADHPSCSSEQCQKEYASECPFYRAKKSAQHAHILIVNHALLLADVAADNRVLPDFNYLIIDEGHHIEDATTGALSFKASQADVDRAVRELGGIKHGLLGRIRDEGEALLKATDYAQLEILLDQTTTKAFQMQAQFQQFVIAVSDFLEEQREGRDLGPYAQQVRILPATRTQPAWFQVETQWEDTSLNFKAFYNKMEQVWGAVTELIDINPERTEDLLGEVGSVMGTATELLEQIDKLVFEPDNERVYWVEIRPQSHSISLCSAPLHIGSLMEEHIWHKKTAVILTSATLTTAGEFNYLQERLNAIDAEVLQVGSPFDYESSAMLYFPTDMPEPFDRYNYQRAIEQSVVNLAKSIGGRTLVLFTSYAQLQQTANAVDPALRRLGIELLQQGKGASAHSLLESFRQSEAAVLMGTRSFWEGVDIVGAQLSAVVITKLPFGVPSDPIIAARAETFEDPFSQFSIPDAILTFRQGFGRLIRSKTDRGVVALLDRRLMSKRYGQYFIQSLPTCTVKQAPLSDLGKEAAIWLDV
jgi:DNA polymerase-3 subunit epsilon/ATP-dependent DNA helicase DinG